MASKVRRSLAVDGEVSRELDRLAQKTGYSASALATQLLREGLRRREALLKDSAESLAYAGLGTAALAFLFVLATLLA